MLWFKTKGMEDDAKMKTLVEEAVTQAMERFLEPRKQVLVKRKAAAKRLGVDVSTLWRWSRSGYLPVTARIGRSVFYSEETLRQFESGKIVM